MVIMMKVVTMKKSELEFTIIPGLHYTIITESL